MAFACSHGHKQRLRFMERVLAAVLFIHSGSGIQTVE